MSTRRKSTINLNRTPRAENTSQMSSTVELERLEQETTLVLQEIDYNLSKANAVINDKMFPILKKYAAASSKIWESVGFWKSFMEEAADIELKAQNDHLLRKISHVADPQPLNSPTINHENEHFQGPNPTLSPLDRPDTSTPNKNTTPHQSEGREGSANQKKSHLRLSVSPRKHTHTPVRSNRRRSVLDDFLGLSPLPQRPVLLSDAGKQVTNSSSFMRATTEEPSILEDSDANDSKLGRLSPIELPQITTTPQNRKRLATGDLNLMNVPTPPILYSVQRGNKRQHSVVAQSPSLLTEQQSDVNAHTYSEQHRNLISDINNPSGKFNVEPPVMASSAPASSTKSANTSVRSTKARDISIRHIETADISGSPVRRNMIPESSDFNSDVFTLGGRVTSSVATQSKLRENIPESPSIPLTHPPTHSRSFSQMIDDVLDQNRDIESGEST